MELYYLLMWRIVKASSTPKNMSQDRESLQNCKSKIGRKKNGFKDRHRVLYNNAVYSIFVSLTLFAKGLNHMPRRFKVSCPLNANMISLVKNNMFSKVNIYLHCGI